MSANGKPVRNPMRPVIGAVIEYPTTCEGCGKEDEGTVKALRQAVMQAGGLVTPIDVETPLRALRLCAECRTLQLVLLNIHRAANARVSAGLPAGASPEEVLALLRGRMEEFIAGAVSAGRKQMGQIIADANPS